LKKNVELHYDLIINSLSKKIQNEIVNHYCLFPERIGGEGIERLVRIRRGGGRGQAPPLRVEWVVF
jgi:hypothetical protein